MPPGDETTAPATSPDINYSQAAPAVTQSMTDDEIRSTLRTAYEANYSYFQATLQLDPRPKDMETFKAILRDIWYTDDEQFEPRFEQLKAEVVDAVAPRLFVRVEPPRTGSRPAARRRPRRRTSRRALTRSSSSTAGSCTAPSTCISTAPG